MILRTSPTSPFGRKCKISASLLRLTGKIEIKNADTMDPQDSMRQENPLGKIPILTLDDGARLYDSRVICEHLDALAGGGKLFPAGEARWAALTLQALADGIADAGVLELYEKRFRPEEIRHQPWVDHQREKIQRALASLEANVPDTQGAPNIGDIALACALGFLDFRFEGVWREGHPNLVTWLEGFAERVPAFGETAPHD